MASTAARRPGRIRLARLATGLAFGCLVLLLSAGGRALSAEGQPGVKLPAPPTTPSAVPGVPPGGPDVPSFQRPPAPGPQPPQVFSGPQSGTPGPRFQFQIDPETPLKDLLPADPKTRSAPRPLTGDDLTKVPVVEFQAAPAKQPTGEAALRAVAHQLAKVNHVNRKKTDGFVEALRDSRPDLAGLPFAMGDACRTRGERSRLFAAAVATVRRAMQPQPAQPAVPPPASSGSFQRGGSNAPQALAVNAVDVQILVDRLVVLNNTAVTDNGFWERYRSFCDQEDQGMSKADRATCEHLTLARIAALMQILAPESPDMRIGLVKYLAGVSHPEATRAIARLAIFSPEAEVRAAAIEALKVRRERDYSDVLLQGMRYPLPAVSKRAADAMIKLERTDLAPQLVDVLEAGDPRAPVEKQVGGKKALVVRELVRINHHRSCLLCHSPGNDGKVSPETLTAAVPIQGEPLPTPAQGYGSAASEVTVRIDVTYLRQDFSALMPVGDAHPWPEMQRFDFLVRERVLGDDEAAAYREELGKPDPNRPNPYQKAALLALRELTGRDAAPTAEAWRKLIELPAPRR